MLCQGGGSEPSGSDGDGMPGERSNGELSSEGDRDAAAELRELEDELCRLTGVHAVRVVGDRSGRPIEVHVLADPSKPAKQTVRDVRAVAQTVFGIELDHRIVSVAQLNTNDQNTPVGIELPRRGEARARVGAINIEAVGLRAQVRVVLVDNEREVTGYAEGSVASAARPNLVAAAALDALRQNEPAAEAIHITSAEISRIGTNRVAVVTVVYVDPPTELVVSGSAVVRRDRDDAVARALLDATNRRLARAERGRSTS
jgi:hypothetical protein